jgi:aminoacyl-tRNA hydrolase
MNLSGEAVVPLARFYQIPPENILVLHDEIDFVTGRIALKLG